MSKRHKDVVGAYDPRCPAGKRGFLSRKDANRYARQRALVGIRPYRCNHDGCEFWHLGHLPAAVTGGTLDRSELRPVHRDNDWHICLNRPRRDS